MSPYALTIFAGAFLLFLVQPLIGKYILPWFGGAPGVWTTCLLFFQWVLLGGYAYAHLAARWLKPRAQVGLHLLLVGAALALLPITPPDTWKPGGGGNPMLQILGLLAACVGLPFLVLSATGPLLQHWFSRTHPGRSPYRLYALSNIASLLALLSFPVLFETHFTRTAQARLWAWGLVVYALCSAWCAVRLWKSEVQSLKSKVQSQEAEAGLPDHASRITDHASRITPPFYQLSTPPTINRLLWLLLPACASVLLLATTNKMCQEVAVIPFLWVLPLSLYLLSFIICFDSPRWYGRWFWGPALLAATAAIVWALFMGNGLAIFGQLGSYAAGLFVCCMVCHGELYRLRPDPGRLTEFYLLIAAGGALGGLFVAVVAPLIFSDYLELHWGLLLCGLLWLLIVGRSQAVRIPRGGHKLATAALALCLLGLAGALWWEAHRQVAFRVERTRTFYGVLTVLRADNAKAGMHCRELMHGRTSHGLQFIDSQRAAWPTLYFGENSGVGLVLRELPAGRRRIGLVGMGTGTLATYARAGDYVHIYEINPEVQRLANTWFSFLRNCPARVEVTLGDGRLSLEQEPPQDFDLIVLDVFNSDAIPIHLLTREAFTIYERHLKTNGIIAIDISNRSLNLKPVVANLAGHFHYQMALVEYSAPPLRPWLAGSTWVLLSRDGNLIHSPALRAAAQPLPPPPGRTPLWTDDFASLFQILRRDAAPEADSAFTRVALKKARHLLEQGKTAGAIAQYRSALNGQPKSVLAHLSLALLLALGDDPSLRNPQEAVRLMEGACQLTGYAAPPVVGALAAAYSEDGRFSDAIGMQEKACYLTSEMPSPALFLKNQQLLKLYRAGRPYHEFKPARPATGPPRLSLQARRSAGTQ